MIDYAAIASQIRLDVLEMTTHKKTSFIGSAYSCIDILTVLYFGIMRISPENPQQTDRDMFILSKGHAASALYATLASRGLFPKERLDEFSDPKGKIGVHPVKNALPGVESSTGSLGHGLSLGVGIALADKIDGKNSKTYVLLGDGEINEGSIWEAVMFGARVGLGNLVAIVDRNRLQSYGTDEDVLNLGELTSKFSAFGWRSLAVDGHNYNELEAAFRTPSDGRPLAVIANTIKGKGVSFIENRVEWHYKFPTLEQYEIAKKELRM